MYPDQAEMAEPMSLAGSKALRSSQLPLSQQEKMIVVLHDTVNTLEQRLNQVLSPELTSQDARNEAADRAPVSPLSEQLHANNRGIGKAVERLNKIMERLEC